MQDHSQSGLFSARDGPSEGKSADDLSDRDLVVVSNRQPYAHDYAGDEITVEQSTGGLTTGLDPFVRDVGGTWIAWGDGDADRAVVDENDRVGVPPDDPDYTLRRVWLGEDAVHEYYYGFSNRVLWPVCHAALGNLQGERRFWQRYQAVNRTFADVVVEELADADDPIVWFQDYHLALAPRMARADVPGEVPFLHFWHIPWPGWDVFRACPHGRALLRGLLGNDVLGFHVERYRENFLECVDRGLDGAVVDRDRGLVHYEGDVTKVLAVPLGVDADAIADRANDVDPDVVWSAFADRHGVASDTRIALGVERLDYTKGILSRLRALERLWADNPGWRGEVTYVQNGTESRSRIPEYEAVQKEVASGIERINSRFGTEDWTPIVYTTERIPREELYGLYRYADLALVSPIRDGLNLVALEYVAAQVGDPGVLVLSDQTGAHDRFGEHAVSVSPHDVAGFADAIATALDMPASERRRRSLFLRDQVESDALSNWIATFAEAATSMEQLRSPRLEDGPR